MKVVMLVLNDMTWDARVDREAAALAEAGHSVTVLALRSDGPAEREQRDGYTIHRVADHTSASWSRPLQKARELRRRTRALVSAAVELAPDIVHAHDTDTLTAAARVAGRLGIPLIYDAHELYPDMIAEFGARGSWPVQWYWRTVERRHIPRAATVITVSAGLATELHARFGVDPVVVRNVPALTPLTRTGRLRAELGLTGDDRCIALYQGVLIPGRGLQTLVEAAARVPGLVLAIQGFGPEEGPMRERVGTLGAGDSIRFMGKKTPTELHEYACGADIGVLIYERTTLNNHLASPNKLYAYLMAGLPVAGSAFPGIAEVVTDERVGLTFDPSDTGSISIALETLTADPMARRQMGGRARMLAETRYNWTIEKQALLDAYARLAATTALSDR